MKILHYRNLFRGINSLIVERVTSMCIVSCLFSVLCSQTIDCTTKRPDDVVLVMVLRRAGAFYLPGKQMCNMQTVSVHSDPRWPQAAPLREAFPNFFQAWGNVIQEPRDCKVLGAVYLRIQGGVLASAHYLFSCSVFFPCIALWKTCHSTLWECDSRSWRNGSAVKSICYTIRKMANWILIPG